MGWIREEQQDYDNTPSDNEDTITQKRDQQGGRWIREEPSTDILRTISSALMESYTRPFETAGAAFGAGDPTGMQQVRNIERKLAGLPEKQEPMTLREKADELTGYKNVPQTSFEKVATEGLGSASDFLTLGGLLPGSPTVKSLLNEAQAGAAFGTGSKMVEENGGTKAAQMLTGLMFALAKPFAQKSFSALKKGIELGKEFLKSSEVPTSKIPKFIEEAGTPKALADLELSQADINKRITDISKENIQKFDELAEKTSPETISELSKKEYKSSDINKLLEEEGKSAVLDTISPVDVTQKEAWEVMGNEIENNFKAVKETYSQMYKAVEKASGNIESVTKNTQSISKKILADLEKSFVNIPEESGLKRTLSEIVDILKPQKIQKTSEISAADFAKALKEGKIKITSKSLSKDFKKKQSLNILQEKAQGKPILPVDRMIAAKRSVNRSLRKSDIIPAPIDLLKPVSRELSNDIVESLAAYPDLLKTWQAAENLFSEAQKTFNNEIISKLRKTATPEEMGKYFTKPSNLEKVKKALATNELSKDLVDRIVADIVSGLPKDKAIKTAQEVMPYMSKKGRKGLQRLLTMKDPLTGGTQRSIAQSAILEDIQKTMSTGSTPSLTKKMMQSKKGYDLVKDTLKRTPQGQKIFKGLQRGLVEDVFNSVKNKDGLLDFGKLKDILKDNELNKVLNDILGADGMSFLKNLEGYGKNFAKNMNIINSKNPGFVGSLFESLLEPSVKKTLIGISPFTKFTSLIPIVAAEGVKQAKRYKMFNILKDKNIRTFIKALGKDKLTSKHAETLLRNLNKYYKQSKD